MDQAAAASREYLKSAVLTAGPEQLHLMLIDGAIRFAQRGRAGLEARDYEAAFNGFDRAQQIVIEMNNGLQRDKNPEVVEPMLALNHFIFRRLVDANVRHDLQAVDDALRILRHQRETWEIILDKVRRGDAPAAPTTPTTQSKSAKTSSTAKSEKPPAVNVPETAGGLSIQV